MNNSTSRSPQIIIIMAVAAVAGLIAIISMIVSNPSRFPQAVQTQVTLAPSPQTPEIIIGGADGATLEETITVAKKDLAQKLGVAENTINVSQSKSVTWGDASLGCPQLGMMYTQMITPGYEVVLTAGGKTYDYRGDTSKHVRLCENPVQ